MGNNINSFFAGLSTLNRILVLVLVVEAILFFTDSRSQTRNLDLLQSQKASLVKQKEQVLLLENLYNNLKQKDASLNQGNPFLTKYDQDMLLTLSDKDILAYVADNNLLKVDWINEAPLVTDAGTSADHMFVMSLKGGYAELRHFLLDLLSWPRIENLPLIQVLASDNTLDITLNVRVYERGAKREGGKVHD